jgi:hypothetical protein
MSIAPTTPNVIDAADGCPELHDDPAYTSIHSHDWW